MGFAEYFFAILAFIVVIGLLLLTTKFLAYKSKKMLKGNYMQIIESLNLGVNNRIHLIKVDKEFFLISASNKNVEFLTKVSIGDFEEPEIKNPITEVIDFKSVLKKYVGGFNSVNQSDKPIQGEKLSNQNTQVKNDIKHNDLTFKNNLEKLKHITNSISGQRSENEQKTEN
jgi:flagellar protein FliO/FliZ